MKKSLFYSLMTTATLLSPVFASPSWAKNCPEIPKGITVITVKSSQASLRTEAKQQSTKSDISILKDDQLKVISFSPVTDLDGQTLCWYEVSAIKDTTKKPYFIANVGIKEFPFVEKPTPSPTSSPIPSPASSPLLHTKNPGKSEGSGVDPKKLSEDFFQQKWIVFVVIGISIGNIIISLLVCVEVSKVRKHLNISGIYRPSKTPYGKGTAPIDIQIQDSVSKELASVAEELKELKGIQSIQRKLKRIQDDLGLPKQDGIPSTHEKLTTQERLLQAMGQNSNKIFEVLQRVEKTNQSNQNDIKFVTRRVEDLEYNQQKTSSSGNQGTVLTTRSESNDITDGEDESEKTEPHALETSSVSTQESSVPSESDQVSNSVTPHLIATSPQLQRIIDDFNRQQIELFRGSIFQLLTLTQDTIARKTIGSVKLEIPNESHQAAYLKFEMDNASWLIPNITSMYRNKIMSRSSLSENPDIFIIRGDSGSDSFLKLVMPAKLKVSTDNQGIWEIEEPGVFQA